MNNLGYGIPIAGNNQLTPMIYLSLIVKIVINYVGQGYMAYSRCTQNLQ